MKLAKAMISSFVLVGIGRAICTPVKVTVFAISKVSGKAKKIEGKVYHLVAIRLVPTVLFLNTWHGSPVLLVKGGSGKLALKEGEKERDLEDTGHRYQLFWLCLPEKSEIEILWGGHSGPMEGQAMLHEQLIKAWHVHFKFDGQKLTEVKPGSAKELLADLGKLAEQLKRR